MLVNKEVGVRVMEVKGNILGRVLVGCREESFILDGGGVEGSLCIEWEI